MVLLVFSLLFEYGGLAGDPKLPLPPPPAAVVADSPSPPHHTVHTGTGQILVEAIFVAAVSAGGGSKE